MNFRKPNKSKMALKKINKNYRKLKSSFNLITKKSEFGIVYTLYSDRLNSIEVGFAENDKILKNKILQSDSILLDKKIGKKQDLNLLIKTLNELNINFSRQLNCRYSNILMRHLSILGWPVGRSLYKQRKIKKELTFV